MADLNIFGKSDGYVIEYPSVLEYEDLQQDIAWTAKEIDVESDINDLRVHVSDAARHGILHTLKLFTHYEMFAGDDYWGGKFKRVFPRVEFVRTGTEFARTELCVHAPFYNAINEALLINTPEFYNSWKLDPILVARMEFIEKFIKTNKFDNILSLAVFSMVEGVVLYSAFAYLKSFKRGSFNSIPNIVSGINFSVRDENLHSEFGAHMVKLVLNESKYTLADVKDAINEAAIQIYDHECSITDELFAKGDIPNVCKEDLKDFVAHRIDVVLGQLKLPPIFEVGETEIAKWFYDDITGAKATDHFVTLSSNYSRNWKEDSFLWPVIQ